MAEVALKSKDPLEFWTACRAAEVLGIDTWPKYYSRTMAGEKFGDRLLNSEIGNLQLTLLNSELSSLSPNFQASLSVGER